MPLRPDDVRRFVSRDWALLAESKRAFWIARRERTGPIDALRLADELRRQVRATRPASPTPAERAADLDAHTALARILARVPAPARR